MPAQRSVDWPIPTSSTRAARYPPQRARISWTQPNGMLPVSPALGLSRKPRPSGTSAYAPDNNPP
jgi:hypothetical protein